MSESPVWLRERGRIPEATKILRKFRGLPTEGDLPAEVEAELLVRYRHLPTFRVVEGSGPC